MQSNKGLFYLDTNEEQSIPNTVSTSHVYNEFAPMHGTLLRLGIELNAISNDEHVPEIERYIRTL